LDQNGEFSDPTSTAKIRVQRSCGKKFKVAESEGGGSLVTGDGILGHNLTRDASLFYPCYSHTCGFLKKTILCSGFNNSY
jgi:hypothetical protein